MRASRLNSIALITLSLSAAARAPSAPGVNAIDEPEDSPAASAQIDQIEVETLATGLKLPWSLAFAPGGDRCSSVCAAAPKSPLRPLKAALARRYLQW